MWTNYDSTGRGVIFRPARLPTRTLFLARFFANLPHISWQNLEISGNTLPSGNYLEFLAIAAKFGETFDEKYANWIGFLRNLQEQNLQKNTRNLENNTKTSKW